MANKVYFTIAKVRVDDGSETRLELHCSHIRRDVEKLDAMSKSVPDNFAAPMFEKIWRDHLKNTLGKNAVEI